VRVRLQWRRRRPSFAYPIPPAPRTAVLVPRFRSGGGVRVFAGGWSEEVAKFAPQAIAATLAQFEAIAATGISLTHAIIILGRWEDERVSEADREALWNRFRVPVFEQIVGRNGTLLAGECEAHYGLHIESEIVRARLRGCEKRGQTTLSTAEVPRGVNHLRAAAEQSVPFFHIPLSETDRIDESACACGRTTARIISREEAAREEVKRSMATYGR